ncbi:MAG: RDD family protein [Capsulimonadales bacterium]|nr:RDD family protein [Capsulimonadales bacterium]
MARQLTIITPENIPLALEPAGLATRFGALLIDLFLQGCALAAVIILWLALSAAGLSLKAVTGGQDEAANNLLSAIAILVGSLVLSGYFIVFEHLWNGQTPGKRAFNLRVVRDNGAPVDFGAVAARNFVRIADMLPISYAVGALTIFFHPTYKRLGDVVAGTVVIKERAGTNLPTFHWGQVKENAPDTGPLPPGALNPQDVLSRQELTLLRQFAARRWQMTSDDSERLAYRLMAPLVSRLNITFTPGTAPRYADLISTLVATADRTEPE